MWFLILPFPSIDNSGGLDQPSCAGLPYEFSTCPRLKLIEFSHFFLDIVADFWLYLSFKILIGRPCRSYLSLRPPRLPSLLASLRRSRQLDRFATIVVV